MTEHNRTESSQQGPTELIEGYRRFRSGRLVEQRGRLRRLAAQGQTPRAVVVACCDSRVDPQTIFDAEPGDLFVIRNVANLVPPYQPNTDYHGTSAALEFAIMGLGIRDIVVMGHASCGGIRALLSGDAQNGDFVGRWMAIAEAARETCCAGDKNPDDPAVQRATEFEVVRLSLANLMTFPCIRAGVKAGTLALHGCLFELASGGLLVMDESGEFRPVSAPIDDIAS